MATFNVFAAISNLPLLNYVGVEDFCDKLSFIATCVFLITSSLVIIVREYIMDPISCYMSHTPGGENLLRFVENYCWVQGTMSINDHRIPDNEEDWKLFEKSRIIYYQWAPFMLLFQAALFHTPRIIWSLITFNMTGINVQDIMKKAANFNFKDFDGKVEKLATRVEYMLVEHREYRRGCFHDFKRRIYKCLPFCVISKRFANRLTCGYLFTKTLYLLNSVGQIYLMQTFLHLNSHKEYSSNFGWEIARNIINGRNWEVTDVFPRVTYCMARVKHMASVNVVTAQCVLTANLFIEKIYIFLWFWIVIVSIFTAFSLGVWLVRFLIPSQYFHEIKKHLKLQSQHIESYEDIDGFCKEFLRLDGIFLLHMISINAGDLVTTPIVNHLYATYLEKYKDKSFTSPKGFQFVKNNYDSDKIKLSGPNSSMPS